MTKADIVGIVAEGTGLTKLETAAVIDGFLATVSYALKTGQRVNLRGFGNFIVVNRNPRTARNPRTREVVHIPARKAPVFRPSREMRDQVAQSSEMSTDDSADA
jgi:nucleoid DNA-binding protein